MKKCPYCAEDIREEAIICRFCNRKLKKQNNLVLFFLLIICILVVFSGKSYIKSFFNKKDIDINKTQILQQITPESKQLITSICMEVNDFVACNYKTLTYGEAHKEYEEFVEKFKELRSKIIVEISSAKNNYYKEFSNHLLLLVDNALALSENQLKITNYGLDNLKTQLYIDSEVSRASNIKSLDTYGTYRQFANQIERDANSSVERIKEKKSMIDTVEKENTTLYENLFEKIWGTSFYLDYYGIDFNVVFPYIIRQLDKKEKVSNDK